MRILKSSVIVLMLSLGMASMPVFAAVPTDESLKELMKITKVDEMARQMMSPENIMSDEMIQDILLNDGKNSEVLLSEFQKQYRQNDE